MPRGCLWAQWREGMGVGQMHGLLSTVCGNCGTRRRADLVCWMCARPRACREQSRVAAGGPLQQGCSLQRWWRSVAGRRAERTSGTDGTEGTEHYYWHGK